MWQKRQRSSDVIILVNIVVYEIVAFLMQFFNLNCHRPNGGNQNKCFHANVKNAQELKWRQQKQS